MQTQIPGRSQKTHEAFFLGSFLSLKISALNPKLRVYVFWALKAYSHQKRIDEELTKWIDEFIHELNQCTVPYGSVHT